MQVASLWPRGIGWITARIVVAHACGLNRDRPKVPPRTAHGKQRAVLSALHRAINNWHGALAGRLPRPRRCCGSWTSASLREMQPSVRALDLAQYSDSTATDSRLLGKTYIDLPKAFRCDGIGH